MARGQQFPNANEPIAQGDGKITRPWFSVLNSLWRNANGGSVTGSGTAGRLAKWLTASSLTDALAAASSKLLGSGASGSGAPYSEITLGTGLSMTGTTLSATGSGGTVTTTGSPTSGKLTKFSGATTITNGDLSGDVTTTGTLATTLANSGASAGTYGNSTNVAQVTVDAKGRVTAVSSVAIGGGGGGGVGGLQGPLESHTAAVSAALNFTSWYNVAYSTYIIEFENLVTAGTDTLRIQFSTDGGVTYDSGGNYNAQTYESVFAVGTTSRGNSSVAGIEFRPSSTATIPTNGSWNASLRLVNPGGALYKVVYGNVAFWAAAGSWAIEYLMGWYNNTTAVNAFRINQTGGATLTSGTVRVYGLAT